MKNKKVRVLISDDQPYTRELVKIALREEEYQVVIADSVGSTLKYLKKYKPDVVLLNSLSEGFDSFDLLTFIKEKHLNIPALVYAIQSESAIIRLKGTIEEMIEEKWKVGQKIP